MKYDKVPQYLLNAGYAKIACTQPRRIACTALARRVATETLKQFNTEIAFQTRFDKTKTAGTRMLFLTEGVLLRQLAMNPDLPQYNVIILDEVHERNTSGDLLVTLLRNLVYRREDLRLILMSATINIDLFSNFFRNAPLIQVPGRLYPIELVYMPATVRDVDVSKKAAKIDPGPYVNILQIIDKKHPSTERGDVLIFLNGISEITSVAEALKEYAELTKSWIVLILHSTLSVEEQNKVFDFAPSGHRKCILSTNIAETSVTIDEVRFVIDSGKENLMRYDSSTRTHRLTESWISKASANQRKGRAGRTGPGICYRLYSNEEFDKMEDFTLPEIKRVSLESILMQILDMNLEIDVRDFEWIERPDPRALNETLESLKSQGVIEGSNEKMLTSLGMILAKLPVDVPIGKMLVYACVLDQIDVVLTIAAGLSVQSPFTNRSYRDNECIQSRQYLISDMGDPFTLLRVYREWLKLRTQNEDTRKWARKCGIEEARLYEIIKLRRQFREILEQSELLPKKGMKEWEALGSRERRIKVGEKRKLYDLKKKAGYEQKRSKILKQGKHFDSIMEDLEGKADQQDDINSLEFSLNTDNQSIQKELTSHRLNDATANIIKMIIASGLYPQFALIDPSNNFKVGHDQFAHCPTKPFCVIHPNSALGQTPEVLQIDHDSEGRSSLHQFLFFGLLLETAKSYLCNSSRIPALYLLINARNVTTTASNVISCDGFVEFHFMKEADAWDVLEKTCEIRRQFSDAITMKLCNDDYGNRRDLEKKIVNFAKLSYQFSIRRKVDPSKNIPCGIFDTDGEEHSLALTEQANKFMDEEEMEQDKQLDEEFDAKKTDEEKLRGREIFCEICNKTLCMDFGFGNAPLSMAKTVDIQNANASGTDMRNSESFDDFGGDSQLADVRILIVGDQGVGKTTIITALLDDRFCEDVPARIETILIPPDVTPDGVVTEIIDYSPREQDENALIGLIKRANVICIVYSVLETGSIDRITTYWLPLIQKTLGGPEHGRPVLLVSNKSDKENETAHIDKMVPIMNDFLEIETVVECSAKIMKNVSEIFYYAQKAVVYPFRPLFRVEERELSSKCKKALVRCFKISDADNDGLLCDAELKHFQMRCFGIPLTKAAIDEVKQVILEHNSQGIIDDSMTLSGFLFLHQMFIQRGRHETAWTVLKRFGYDLNLQLRQDYLLPTFKIKKGCSTELSPAGIHFISKIFRKYDEDHDDCLSNTELQNLFSVCPSFPWTKEALHSVETNSKGWITFNGYINLWTLNFAINLTQSLEQLAYLGFNVEYKSQLEALTITRERRLDVLEKCTSRKVFQCHVIGPKGAGKTVFGRSLIGKTIQEINQMNKRHITPYVINTVKVKDEFKHLLLHEVDVYSENDLLTSYEKTADVVCLLYDATNPNSFAYCATIYLRYFYRTKVPCLVVATKVENYEIEQNYEYQPKDFCQMHQLPKPIRFYNTNIGNPNAPVFSQLATMATFPHLKRVYFLQDFISTTTIFTVGAAAALVAFLLYKNH
ncbi:EF hand associated domain-containing protein [Ditylenchus destructor]|nr:EF hand associated domain-containing protein [Ditylenchus destructor]